VLLKRLQPGDDDMDDEFGKLNNADTHTLPGLTCLQLATDALA
jgi:hypothetical protein